MNRDFVSIDGGEVFYTDQGEGIPIVYVHGNTGSHLWYERVMDVPGARTVALDLPNFGRSKPLPGTISIDRYADAVAACIVKLKLDKPILVGHSLGGAVAISLAARFPDLISGLILVDSAAPSGLATPRERHPLIEMMRTNRNVLTQALRAIAPTLHDDAFFESLVDDALRMAPAAWVGNAEALGSFDYTNRCSAFSSPVLVVWGRGDIVITEAMARETAAAFPKARLEILEDVGHSVIVEDPRRFLALLQTFINERRAS